VVLTLINIQSIRRNRLVNKLYYHNHTWTKLFCFQFTNSCLYTTHYLNKFVFKLEGSSPINRKIANLFIVIFLLFRIQNSGLFRLAIISHSMKQTKDSLLKCQVLTAANMKMTVSCDVAPWSLVEVYQRFRDACCLHHQGEDGGIKHLWNVGKFLPDNTAQHHRQSHLQETPCTKGTPIARLIYLRRTTRHNTEKRGII
jgi:hypothetical protein